MTKASKLKKYLITHWEIWDMKSHYQPPQVDLSELNSRPLECAFTPNNQHINI